MISLQHEAGLQLWSSALQPTSLPTAYNQWEEGRGGREVKTVEWDKNHVSSYLHSNIEKIS